MEESVSRADPRTTRLEPSERSADDLSFSDIFTRDPAELDFGMG